MLVHTVGQMGRMDANSLAFPRGNGISGASAGVTRGRGGASGRSGTVERVPPGGAATGSRRGARE
ncbi:predicted protein [Streptomyces viridosporus ATCC 14672]|uniref:Predicted protein n=1 Tax=Streptomyces viridosporus (strain ATCC 14672 / DSM 40746 / JCM 4963 / KCTC 9882 / NRRL B-12104 / FH 1290) TaxID=566461 RepID=D5ZPQ3_STRV1|nr:predicted protein [Streptomyces viridosporus ATCC 14672]